jgi:multiple sugar transport system substrate-binding protein
MKRLATLLVCGLMVAGVVYAGGGQEQAAGEEQQVITFTTHDFASPQNLPKLQEYIDQFTEETGIRVEVTVGPDAEYRTKLLQEAAAGNASDVALVDGQWVPEFARLGYLQSLEEYYTPEFRERFFDFAVEGSMIDGTPYAVWWHTGLWSLYYRQDLLEEAGYSEPPADWNELVEMGKALTVDRNNDGVIDTYGLAIPGAKNEVTSTTLLPWFWGNGGHLVDDNGDVTFDTGEDREAMVSTLSFIDDLVNKHGIVTEDMPSLSFTDVEAVFLSGEAAMALLGSWHYASLEKNGGEEFVSNVGISPIPAVPGNEPTTTAGGWAMGIFTDDPEKQEAAWKFMEYWSDIPIQKFLTREAGQMTAVKTVYQEPELRNDEVMQGFVAGLENATTRPGVPFYDAMSAAYQDMIQKVVIGTLEPEAAVEQAGEKVREEAEKLE